MKKNMRAFFQKALSSNKIKLTHDKSLSPAAVLVILYFTQNQYHIILNRRTDKVEHHKGEISFPGGSKDQNDRDLLDTALRETYEEMGVLINDVEVLGKLNSVPTSSHFLITPYVATIPNPYKFELNRAEVESVIEVPITSLIEYDIQVNHNVTLNKTQISNIRYSHEGNIIFGATARILNQFIYLIDRTSGKENLWPTVNLNQ